MKRRFSQLSKNIKILMMAVVATAIIAGGAVYIWQQVSAKKDIAELQQQINNLQNQIQQLKQNRDTNITPADETINWKTYRNEKRSFEITYPKDWEMDVVDPWRSIDFTRETSQENIRFAIGIDLYGEFGGPFAGCTFTGKGITVEGFEVYSVIFSNMKDERPSPTREECKKQILGDVHTVYLEMCFDEKLGYLGDSCPTCPGSSYCSEWKKEGYVGDYYQFYFRCEGEKWQGREGMNKCSQLFNQILSTFKFSEALNEDYLNALRTADLFLTAIIKRDAESGYNLLSERLKNEAFKKGYSKDDLLIALSGLSNPHHHAFEIFNGWALEENIYEFQVFFYDYYTGQEVEFNKGKPELLKLVKRQEGEYTKWYVDSLPQDIGIYLYRLE